jgi:hypothetical protein
MAAIRRASQSGHARSSASILDPDLYARLAGSFPLCPANTGPTGYTLFWGDPEYDRLMAQNDDWAALFAAVHSQSFIDRVLALFPAAFAQETKVDLSRARYVPYCESRADKQRDALARVEHTADELWVRLDIMQGRTGYMREPHLDHRRRAISMLIYFSDGDEDAMRGGDLVLHGGKAGKLVVRPRHNRMVVFPCHARSVHSVSRIRSQRRPRNFVQVTVSSSVDIWKGDKEVAPSPLKRARRVIGGLLRSRHPG